MQDLVAQLANHNDHLPEAALRQALADWPTASRTLYASVERYLTDPDSPAELAEVVFFTLFLAAEKRDPAGFALACRLGADSEAMEIALGDEGTEVLARVLLSS